MLTLKENFLETIKPDGKPDRLASCYTPFVTIDGDPIFWYLFKNRVPGTNSYDPWGTYIMFPADQPAALPYVTAENQIVKDIEHWRDYLKVPDLEAECSDGWETAKENRAKIDGDHLATSYMFTGLFEQLHQIMTFEDTLCNLLMYPDEMQELIDVINDYRMTYARMLIENVHPDVIVSHDDVGSKTSLFMAPETWRELFKEPYRKFYGYLRENGVIVIHHSDSYVEPLVEDFAEIGVNVLQGVLPTNDIVGITKKLDGKMAIMGGIDSLVDRGDASEEEIRTEVRRVLNEYGNLPHFIPSYTYGDPGTIYPNVEPIILDEINRYNKERFGVSD